MIFGDTRLPERFWAKVQPESNSGCWLWQGSTDGRGYGQIWNGKKAETATRYIARALLWAIDGLGVLHRCDTPACTNPAHLWVGTQTDNMRDAAAKGRTDNGRHGREHARAYKARRNREYGLKVTR